MRAAAEAWGMGPLTALHYTAVLRSVGPASISKAIYTNLTEETQHKHGRV